jgi:hypothetical protein
MSLDFRRFTFMATVFFPAIVGIGYAGGLALRHPGKILVLFLAFLIVVSFLLSSLAAYQSPFVGVQNQQVMPGEIIGMRWIIDEVPVGERIYDYGENQWLQAAFPESGSYNFPYSQFMYVDRGMVLQNQVLGPNFSHVFTITIFREVRISADSLPVPFYVSVSQLVNHTQRTDVVKIYDNGDYSGYLVW